MIPMVSLRMTMMIICALPPLIRTEDHLRLLVVVVVAKTNLIGRRGGIKRRGVVVGWQREALLDGRRNSPCLLVGDLREVHAKVVLGVDMDPIIPGAVAMRHRRIRGRMLPLRHVPCLVTRNVWAKWDGGEEEEEVVVVVERDTRHPPVRRRQHPPVVAGVEVAVAAWEMPTMMLA